MNDVILSKVIGLKSEGYENIYYVEIDGLGVLLRPLSLHEWNDITSLERYLEPWLVNDLIVHIAVLYCTFEGGLAAWTEDGRCIDIDVVAQHILDVSGFADQDTFLKRVAEKRDKAMELQSIMEGYICSAFHTYSPKDIQQLDQEQMLELFAKAEQVIGQPIDFNKIFGDNKGKIEVPIPKGYETTAMPGRHFEDPSDILSEDNSDVVDWDKIEKGYPVY